MYSKLIDGWRRKPRLSFVLSRLRECTRAHVKLSIAYTTADSVLKIARTSAIVKQPTENYKVVISQLTI